MNKVIVYGLVFVFVIVSILGIVFVRVERANTAVILTNLYEFLSGHDAQIVNTPFTDIGNLSVEQKESIQKIYGLGITIGTSATTYSPVNKLEVYQVFLFAGRLLEVLN